MTKPAIQLYAVRDFDEPLPAVVERVGAAGYEGVEFANRIHDADPAAVADALDDAGLEAVSAHVSLGRLETDLEANLDRYERVGCRDLVVPHLPAAHFRTERRVEAIAAHLQTLGRQLDERGFRLHYHNQAHDFLPLTGDASLGQLLTGIHPDPPNESSSGLSSPLRTVGGRLGDRLYERLYQRRSESVSLCGTAFRYFAEATEPSVGLQIDVGSVVAAGYDPIEVLDRVAERTTSVHLKDVAVADPGPTTAVHSVPAGDGMLDVPSIRTAVADADVDWIVYENDEPPDPETTLEHGARALDATPSEGERA